MSGAEGPPAGGNLTAMESSGDLTLMDPETAAFLRQMNAGAAGEGDAPDIHQLRAASRLVFLSMEGAEKAGARMTPLKVPTRSGEMPARLYTPEGLDDRKLPLVIFVHGGGWSIGDLDCYHGLCTDLCAQSGVRFLALDQRLAPEFRFPAAIEDVCDALAWVTGSAGPLKVDPARIAIMGDSSGGNLAAVVAQLSSVPGGAALAAQFLIYPMTDVSRPHSDYGSRQQFGDGDFLLTRQNIDEAVERYSDPGTDIAAPEISPLNGAGLDRLPPTVLLAARYDPLFDEGQEYVRRLIAAGVEVRTRTYPSIHPFLSFGALAVARKARSDLARDVASILSRYSG